MTIMKNPLDDHRFYRLLFPFRPPEFEFKGLDNPELINKLYQKYLKASSNSSKCIGDICGTKIVCFFFISFVNSIRG